VYLEGGFVERKLAEPEAMRQESVCEIVRQFSASEKGRR
jgi:hypothetical protein